MFSAVVISVGALLLGYFVLTVLSGGHPPTGPSLIILALFVYGVLPQGIQVFEGGRFRLAASIVELPSPLAQQTSRVMVYVILLVAIGVFAGGLLTDTLRMPRWLLIFSAPWIALAISAYANYHTLSIPSVAYILTGVAVALAPKAMTALPTIGYLTGILGGLSILVAIFYPSVAFFQVSSDSDKALFGNQLLAGPLLHPNSLGQTLALGAPFLLTIPNEILRRASYVIIALVLPFSGSRTSMAAVLVGFLTYGALRVYSRGTRWPYVALSAVSFIVGPYFVLTSNSQSFSGRGAIWSSSLAWWERQPWIGQGPKFYRAIADTMATKTDLPTIAYHGHNIGVNALAVSGILGLSALILFLVYSVRNAPLFIKEPSGYGIALFPLMFIVDGWLEVPTDFYTMGSIAWVVWVPFAILCKGPHRLTPIDSSEGRPLRPGQARSGVKLTNLAVS